MVKPSAVPEGKGMGLPSGNARLWHESIPNVEGASERKRKKNAPKEETVQQLQSKAKAALEREVVLLDSDRGRKGKSSNNDAGFLRKIMASGTLSDKMVSNALRALRRIYCDCEILGQARQGQGAGQPARSSSAFHK